MKHEHRGVGFESQERRGPAEAVPGKRCKHDNGFNGTFVCLLCGVSDPPEAYPFERSRSDARPALTRREELQRKLIVEQDAELTSLRAQLEAHGRNDVTPRVCGNAGCEECYGRSSRPCKSLQRRRPDVTPPRHDLRALLTSLYNLPGVAEALAGAEDDFALAGEIANALGIERHTCHGRERARTSTGGESQMPVETPSVSGSPDTRGDGPGEGPVGGDHHCNESTAAAVEETPRSSCPNASSAPKEGDPLHCELCKQRAALRTSQESK